MTASKQPFAITAGFVQDPNEAVTLCKTYKMKKNGCERCCSIAGNSDHDLYKWHVRGNNK